MGDINRFSKMSKNRAEEQTHIKEAIGSGKPHDVIGEDERKEKKTSLMIQLSPDLKRDLKTYAAKNGLKIRDIVIDGISQIIYK